MKTLVATAEPESRPKFEQALVGHILHWNPYRAEWMIVRSVVCWHRSWEKR